MISDLISDHCSAPLWCNLYQVRTDCRVVGQFYDKYKYSFPFPLPYIYYVDSHSQYLSCWFRLPGWRYLAGLWRDGGEIILNLLIFSSFISFANKYLNQQEFLGKISQTYTETQFLIIITVEFRGFTESLYFLLYRY